MPYKHRLSFCRSAQLGPLLRALDSASIGDVVLKARGVEREELLDPYALFSLAKYIELFEASAKLLRETDLGLRLGKELKVAEMGPLGLMFLAAPTLKEGLENFSRFIETWQGSTVIDISNEDDLVHWRYKIVDDQIWPRGQDSEFSLSALCHMFRGVLSSAWSPLAVHFEHAPLSDPLTYKRIFQCPVFFNQAANSLVLSTAELNAELKTADPYMSRMMLTHAAQLRGQQAVEVTLLEDLRAVIERRLLSGKVNVNELATELGYAPRTLQRYLAQEGTSIREQVALTRMASAEMLTRQKISRVEIAKSLGYADSASLWRAERAWAKSRRTP